jgi:hypothetical protein
VNLVVSADTKVGGYFGLHDEEEALKFMLKLPHKIPWKNHRLNTVRKPAGKLQILSAAMPR